MVSCTSSQQSSRWFGDLPKQPTGPRSDNAPTRRASVLICALPAHRFWLGDLTGIVLLCQSWCEVVAFPQT